MPVPVAVPSTMGLAARNLGQDRLRFLLSVAGVGLALMLVLFLLGLREGALRSSGVYLDNAPGSVAVLPPGVSTTSGARNAQLISAETIGTIGGVPGVGSLTPILLTMGFADLHGTKELIRLAGYEPGSGGGPWSLHSGREPREHGEVVVDRLLASRHGLRLGDRFEIGGHAMTVVGLSNGTSSWTGSYAFAPKSAVESLLLREGAASIVLVTPDAGIDRSELVERLAALGNSNVLLKSQVMANDRQVLAGAFDQVIMVMVAAAFVVGALVVGMVIYTATSERRAEYGILKAIGAQSGVLYRIVVFQALATAILGAALGVAFTYGAGALVGAVRPQYTLLIEPMAIAGVLAGGIVIAVTGAVVPARAIARLAPAEAFGR